MLYTATMYRYDGNGRRVMKIDCPTSAECQATTTGAVVTRYAYDVNGVLAAEYASTASVPPCLTCYVMEDHLGSRRALTGSTGTAARCHDYEPYGEEVPGSSTLGRTGCYGATALTGLLFTGKERDGETGLDYFGARYYSAAQGRFTSPDPITVTALRLVDPQQFNRYAYARGNPLRFIDPDGMDPIPAACEGPGDNTCYKMTDQKEAAQRADQMYAEYLALRQAEPPPQPNAKQLAAEMEKRTPASNALIGVVAGGSAGVGVAGGAFVALTGLSSGGLTALTTGGQAIGVEGLTAEQVALVSRWGRAGLQAGDWVMGGGTGVWTYLLSCKWQPGMGNRFASFTSGQNFLVPKTTITSAGWAEHGAGWVKTLFNQRIYRP